MEGVRNYTRIEIVLRSNSWPQHVTDLRKCPLQYHDKFTLCPPLGWCAETCKITTDKVVARLDAYLDKKGMVSNFH